MSDSNQGRDPSRFETIPSRPILQAAQRDRGIPLRLRPAGVPAVGRIFGKIVNCRVQASAKTAALPILSTTTGVTRTRALVRGLLPVFDRCRLARFRVIGRTRSCWWPLRTTISSSSVGSVGESKKDNDYRRFCDSWSYFGVNPLSRRGRVVVSQRHGRSRICAPRQVTICRGARTTSDPDRACSAVPVDSGDSSRRS